MGEAKRRKVEVANATGTKTIELEQREAPESERAGSA